MATIHMIQGYIGVGKTDIVAELSESGYVIKERDGRRNRYQLQTHMPLESPVGREGTIGELLTLLVDHTSRPTKTRSKSR
jgi:hypothetical protein